MAKCTIILTGGRGIGKTTVCREAVALAQADGYTCGGILTLSQPDGELDVLDVHSGDTRRLTVGPNEENVVIQGHFRFDPETLAWGNEVLDSAQVFHLLVIDELGPLEIERGGGWHRAFDALHRNDHLLAVVVVRPELVAHAQLRFPVGASTVLTVTHDDRDSFPLTLLETLKRQTNQTAGD